MLFRSITNMLASKDLRAQAKLMEIMKVEGGLIFYHAALETGLLRMLGAPSTLDELARGANIADRQLFSSLLDLGCSLKEISFKNGRYRATGTVARALARNVPLAELVRETVLYHADVARRLGSYLVKNGKGDYLGDYGGVIAESSRLMEPLIKAFIYHAVKKTAPLSILEIGCGSGEYLRYYVDINGRNGGVAIDKDPAAVEIARRKLRENGIAENFTVAQDDIRKPAAIQGRDFDLVTSFSNIYYFSDGERAGLLESVRGLLKENGRFLLATAFKTGSLSSCYYDLLFTATNGLYPLPRAEELVREMKAAGFSRVKIVDLLGKTFRGVVAYR